MDRDPTWAFRLGECEKPVCHDQLPVKFTNGVHNLDDKSDIRKSAVLLPQTDDLRARAYWSRNYPISPTFSASSAIVPYWKLKCWPRRK